MRDDDNEYMEFVKPPGFGDENTGRDKVEEFYLFWSTF